MYLKFVEKTRYYENDVLIVCKKCYEATEEEQMEKEEKLAREELQH
jgi:predicted metal-binding protein